MKALYKLRNKSRYLVTAAGLVLMTGLAGIRASAADAPATAASPSATTSTTTPAAKTAAKSTAKAAPKKTAKTAATTTAATPAATTTAAAPAPAAADTTDIDVLAPPEYTNWVTLGAGSAFVDGNKGQYRHQQGTNSGPSGGVEDFHWQQFIGKDVTFTMDGRAIFGDHDYALKLDLTDEKIGYIRAGYREYRTWYDPTGGFYPLTSLSFQPNDTNLFVDRRNAWIEAGLTLPDLPVFVVRYEFDSRQGMMDSTSWGQTTLIPGGAQTKIVPTFQGIDETRHIFTADATDKIDDTTAGLGMRYEIDRTDDSTFIEQSPGQAAQADITQQEIEKDDLFSAHGSTETVFDQMVTFSSGFSVTSIDTALGSGNRTYGSQFNSPQAPGFANNGSGFIGLGGNGNAKDYVGDVNLMLTPIANLVIVPSTRLEYEDSNLSDNFVNTSGVGAGFTTTPESANTNNWDMDLIQNVEARYTGFRDWSLYTSTEVSEDWGNNSWNSAPVLNQVNFNQDYNMLGLKLTAGANWYPLAELTVGTQYYHQLHDYDYTNRQLSTLVQYPGYLRKQNFTTDDFNIRATWQALSNVSLTTRYDFQFSTVDTWGIPNGGFEVGGVESATEIYHIISEDLNWTPLPYLYFQVGGSYVLDTMETPVAGSAGINNLVVNGLNNYWTLDASIGYEINSKTHLQLQYSYYNADDYVNTVPTSLPYGAGAQENSVTATLTREINKDVKVALKYGFYRNRDQTSGGLNDYDAQVVYASTTFGF